MIVTAGLVVAGLGILGDLPGQRPSGSENTAFQTARSAAEAAASAHSPTNLSLSWAVGYLSRSPVTAPLNFTHYPSRGPECTFAPEAMGTRNLSAVPNVTSGVTTDWTFVFANGTGEYVVVDVADGVAVVVGLLEGFGCPFSFPGSGRLPLTVVDPAAASQLALHTGGLAFLARYPGANGTLTLIASSLAAGVGSAPEWWVEYSNCPAAGLQPGTGVAFVAAVNATSGSLVGTQNVTVDCPWVDQVQTVPLGLVLAVSSAFGSSAGSTYWYNSTVRSLSYSFPIGTLTPTLQGPTGAALSIPGAQFAVVDGAGAVRAGFDLSSGVWTSGGATVLAVGDRFVLTSPVSLSGQGDFLTLIGSGFFPGSVGIPIY